MLKETYFSLLKSYNNSEDIILKAYNKILHNYNKPKRHYHNLNHLQALLNELEEIKNNIANWDAILFALYYHDFIYSVTKKDNEEQSALFAQKEMQHLNIPITIIENCTTHILATKSHIKNQNPDTNYFIDADLSILGSEENNYKKYCRQIRKEYSIYPSFIYNPGRKKVIQHFLQMNPIYKTEYFYNKYEAMAKQNLEKELATF